MALIGKWSLSSAGLTTVMVDADITPATNGNFNTSTTIVSNDTNLDMFVDVELAITSGFSPPAPQPFVQIYLFEAVDGTNFPAPSSAADNLLMSANLIATIHIGSTAGLSERAVYRRAVIPPGKFKAAIRNMTGTSFPVSGNTVKFLPYNVTLNA